MHITMIKLVIIKINQCTFECENMFNVGLMVFLSQPALVPRNRMPVTHTMIDLKAVYTLPDSCTVRLSIKKKQWKMISIVISR